MEHARRQIFDRRVGRRETEDVGVANRLGAHAGAHRIADHTADARVGPAVRLQGRRMVVRLDLEHDVVLIVEADHAGVVRKHADAPVPVAGLPANLLRGRENRLLEHVLESLFAVFVAIVDSPGQRFMAAMLAPRLGDRFQLNVRRIAAQRAKVGLNDAHFDQRQEKLPLPAESRQFAVAHRSDGHRDKLEAGRRADRQPREVQGAEDHLFDCVVGQHLRAQHGEPVVGKRPHGIFFERADCFGANAQTGDGLHGTLGHRVHDARLRQHVDPMRPAGWQPGQRCIAHRRHHRAFHNAIGEQLVGDPLDLPAVELALNQEPPSGSDGQGLCCGRPGGASRPGVPAARNVRQDVQFGCCCGCFPRPKVRLALGGVNVNFPKHRGSSGREQKTIKRCIVSSYCV